MRIQRTRSSSIGDRCRSRRAWARRCASETTFRLGCTTGASTRSSASMPEPLEGGAGTSRDGHAARGGARIGGVSARAGATGIATARGAGAVRWRCARVSQDVRPDPGRSLTRSTRSGRRLPTRPDLVTSEERARPVEPAEPDLSDDRAPVVAAGRAGHRRTVARPAARRFGLERRAVGTAPRRDRGDVVGVIEDGHRRYVRTVAGRVTRSGMAPPDRRGGGPPPSRSARSRPRAGADRGRASCPRAAGPRGSSVPTMSPTDSICGRTSPSAWHE